MELFIGTLIFLMALATLGTCWRKRSSYSIKKSNSAIFISGCDTGLGNYLARYLDGLGCSVFAGCLDSRTAKESLPESVTVIPLDVCEEDSVKSAVEEVRRILAKNGDDLWGLINNAGVCVYGEFEWQTWKQCQRQVDVNLLGSMRLTKAFIPLLKAKKGRIITITSVNGSISYPGLSIYCATKFALEGLCHAIRLELRRLHGIQVVIIEPGDFARLTSIMSQHEKNANDMWENMSEEEQQQNGEFFRMYHRVPLKNYGLTSPPSLEGSQLLKDVQDALFSRKPRIRYISASIQYRVFYMVVGMLPQWLVDVFFDKVRDMLFKTDNQ